jgi:indole-3-pyruvate monooxygenase
MFVKQTNTLIIGASISGLASAACLQNRNIDYLIIEKLDQVATPWRNHYERLHLHTSKGFSHLPYRKFGKEIPKYPSRQQVVDYLNEYQLEFSIEPVFNTEAVSIRKEDEFWITETNNGSFKSTYLIMATGPYGIPKPIYFEGKETFPGKILHSCEYKKGRVFKGQHVLVVGFGNSAGEIAIDLVEQGSLVSMAVRSAVNAIPRDVFGLPVLELSILLNRLSPKIADAIGAPLINWLMGDLSKLGLRKLPYGPLELIRRDGHIPLLDIGTLSLIRQGQIKIQEDIDHAEGETIHFKDGNKQVFQAIVAAIGYEPNYPMFMDLDKNRFEDLQVSTKKQQYFGKEGLYFCGFWISPTGQIREISSDAQIIARDIAKKESQKQRYN